MHNNQRGLSLVEILAGIVLLGIITTLTTIIFTNSFDRNDTSAKEISLKQDTNLMISQMRKEFYDEKNEEICLDTQGERVNLVYEKNEENEEKKTRVTNSNGEIVYENGRSCIKNFNRDDPIELELYTENTTKKELKIKTILRKGGHTTLGNKYSDIDPCELDWDNIETKKTLPCNTKGNFIWNGTDKETCTNYTVNGNLKVESAIDNNRLEKKKLTVKKNACFMEKVNPRNTEFIVNGNISFNKEAQFVEGSSFDVKGNAYFKNSMQIDNGKNENFKIGRDANFKDEVQIDKAHFTINGNAEFDNSFQTKNMNNNRVTIGKDANFKGQFQIDKTRMNIGGESFFKNLTLIQNHSYLTLYKPIFFQETQIQDHSEVIVNDALKTGPNPFKFQLQTQTSLYVIGNADFGNFVVDKDNRKRFCIKGNLKPATLTRDKNCTYPS